MIKGIVFPEQYVPAAGHGAIFNRMLSDGILAGCDMSYSGTIFNISKGYFIVGGRELEVEGTESIEITQNAGYARIKAVIDNSKVATEEEFEQYETVIEYAATVTDFSDLQKEDLNMSATAIYEAEIAILSLGTEGITGVMRAMNYASITRAKLADNAVSETYTATFPASGWTKYTNTCGQSIAISGLKTTDTLIVDIDMSNISNGKNMVEVNEAWGAILKAKCSTNGYLFLEFDLDGQPSIDLPVKVVAIRK